MYAYTMVIMVWGSTMFTVIVVDTGFQAFFSSLVQVLDPLPFFLELIS